MFYLDKETYRTKKSYTTSSKRNISYLVLHYTAAGFESSVSVLTNGAVSAHYLVPDERDSSYLKNHYDDLRVFNLVDEENIAWHAGISSWQGVKSLNNESIGVENVNLASYTNGSYTFPTYGDRQIEAIVFLCKKILLEHSQIKPTHVVAHSDISPGRKSDPGPQFPWRKLFENGIGAWYDESTYSKYEKMFSDTLPEHSVFFKKLSDYGYDIHCGASSEDLIRAFQLHFMPSSKLGVIDVNTSAALFSLTDKYK